MLIWEFISDDFPPPFHTKSLMLQKFLQETSMLRARLLLVKLKNINVWWQYQGIRGIMVPIFSVFFLYAIKSKIKPSGFVTKPINILIYIQKLYFHVFTCTYIEYYGNFIVPYFHIYIDQHNVTNYIFTMLQIFNSQIWQDNTFST